MIIGWYWSSSRMPVCWTSLLIFGCDLYSLRLLCVHYVLFSLFLCVQTCWTEHRRNANYPRLMGFRIVKANWRWVFLETRWGKLLDLKRVGVVLLLLWVSAVPWWLLICWTLFRNHFHPESRQSKIKALCGTFPLQTLTARYWFVLRHIGKLLTAMVLLMSRALQESWALRKVRKE